MTGNKCGYCGQSVSDEVTTLYWREGLFHIDCAAELQDMKHREDVAERACGYGTYDMDY